MTTIEENLTIRSAEPHDMGSVASIFAYYVNETAISFELEAPSREDWLAKRRDLRSSQCPFLVALLDAEVIGYAYVAPWRKKPAYRQTVESTIYLSRQHTGKGYGQQLLAALLARARAAGACQVIAVIADTGRRTSVGLHQRAGFRNVGRLRDVGHKHGKWLDVVLMQFALNAHCAA